MSQLQHQQDPAPAENPMEIEPAHVMRIERHRQREHYEAMAREAQAYQQK